MSNKVTWNSIYSDFRQRHPNLQKHVAYWRPYDYATIILYMDDNYKFTYNYDSHMLKRLI